MKFFSSRIPEAWVIEPEPFKDERGRFMRSWCRAEFAGHQIEFVPVQANMAFSKTKGTLRGLHYQAAPALEAKLVRCTRGAVCDVVLDVRENSSTFGAWHAETLTADNGKMLLIPEGCAHGCQALTDESEIYYLTSAIYTPDAVRGIRFDDPAFDISWPLSVSAISEQDRSWPLWGSTRDWR